MEHLDAFDGQDHSDDIAIYRAIIGPAGAEQSSLWLQTELGEELLNKILLLPAPHFIKSPWPPTDMTGQMEKRSTLLALLRLRAGVELGCGSSINKSSDLAEEEIYLRNPQLQLLRWKTEGASYRRFRFSASIDSKGEHGFCIGTHTLGWELPLAEPSTEEAAFRGTLPMFLQCSARVDLLRRAERLQAVTNSA